MPTPAWPAVPLDSRLLVAPAGSTRARRLPPGGRRRCALLVLALVLLSLPSVAGLSFGVRLGLVSGDVKVFQAVVLVAAVALLAWHRALRPSGTVAALLLLVWAIALANAGTALVSDPRLLPPLARGIANFALNVLAALAASQLLRRAGTATVAAAVAVFGALVAASAVVEYALLRSSMAMLLEWRNVVWGSVDPDDLLKIGGVTLDPTGLARVGGMIGAPENLGYVLALTLPFVTLLEPGPYAQTTLLGLYALAAVVTGSRTLTIGIAMFGLLALRPRHGVRGSYRRAAIAVAALAALGLAWSSVNEEAFSRFSPDALRYELDWRSERLSALVSAAGRQPYGWLTGIGLGSGADLQAGLESVTSGMLGGDVAVAAGLGGLVGVAVLAALWATLLALRHRVRHPATRRAVDVYLAFVGATSLLFPVLMQLVLSTGIICALLVAFPAVADEVGTR